MKLIIDNANIDDIRSMYEYFPMDGVTCNPTILAKEKRPPYEVLKEIRDFIEEGELHVQVLSDHQLLQRGGRQYRRARGRRDTGGSESGYEPETALRQ